VSVLSTLWNILYKLPAPVHALLLELVQILRTSKNPERDARRAVEEAARLQAFDTAMRRRRK
jgi:hypothetical protein